MKNEFQEQLATACKLSRYWHDHLRSEAGKRAEKVLADYYAPPVLPIAKPVPAPAPKPADVEFIRRGGGVTKTERVYRLFNGHPLSNDDVAKKIPDLTRSDIRQILINLSNERQLLQRVSRGVYRKSITAITSLLLVMLISGCSPSETKPVLKKVATPPMPQLNPVNRVPVRTVMTANAVAAPSAGESFALAWDAVSGATGYCLYASTNRADWRLLLRSVALTNSITGIFLPQWFRVTAFDATDESPPSNEIVLNGWDKIQWVTAQGSLDGPWTNQIWIATNTPNFFLKANQTNQLNWK